MNKIKRITIILSVILLAVVLFASVVSNAYTPSAMLTIVNAAAEKGDSSGAGTAANKIGGAIISIAKIICAGIAVVMLLTVGMKYMIAAPSDRADIKKHAVVYIVGAVIMFAATGILSIIQAVAAKIG